MLQHWLSRRSWRRLGLYVSLSGCCLLLVLGCRSNQTPSGSTASSAETRIAIGTTAKVRTLDPADALEIFAGNLLYNMGDRLYTYASGSTQLVPQLATALPKVSEDGLLYTIPLRTKVLFHDGTPFNAKAMAFSLNRFIQNGGQPAFLLKDTVASVTANSETELTLRLKKPFASFPNLLAFSGLVAVSPKAYKIGPGEFQPSTFVGTGPYKLSSSGSDSIRLEPNPTYWGDKPQNKGIDIQSFSSSANLFNAFRTGAVDIAYQSLNPDQIASLDKTAQQGDWQGITGSGNNITYLSLNLRDPVLKDKAVRQALGLVINRKLIQDRVFSGQVEPLYSLIPSIFKESKPVFEESDAEASLAKAKELLSKAGYSKGKPMKLQMWYRSNVPSDAPAATTIKAYIAQELGDLIDLELNSVESATAYTNLDKGTYPMFMLDWSGDYYDPDTYIHPFLHCAKGSPAKGCEEGSTVGQGSFYFSPKMNQLIDQQRQETNPTKRDQVFAEIQKLLAEDVPFRSPWQRKEYVFAQRDVEGVRLEPTQ
ncbi:MAG: peptide ABC transporter substrate-binding protein, partial [Acaryochloridaceae cyanobacterium CSU_5_19]|nr:peptide ABC transporter substrate-binding protein [Acaryochloridaceae cyanobacterium CSU_5_19]